MSPEDDTNTRVAIAFTPISLLHSRQPKCYKFGRLAEAAAWTLRELIRSELELPRVD